MLDKFSSVSIESIDSIDVNLDGTIILTGTEAYTYRHGTKKLFYKAESVKITLNAFPGSRNNIELVRVDLNKPTIYISKDKSGIWNTTWAFTPAEKPPELVKEQDKTNENNKNMPPKKSFPTQGIHIENGTLQLQLDTESGDSTKWAVTNVSATIQSDDATLSISPFTGTFYGGTFNAKKADFTSGKTDIQISITKANVGALSSRLNLENQPKGTLDAVLTLTKGDIRTESHLVGAGQIEIREADLWDLPIFTKVLALLALDPISERKIDEAHLLFTIEKDRFRVDQMDFIGHPVSLFGEGEMSLTGKDLHVVFIPQLGRKKLDQMLPIIGTPIQWLIDIVKGVFVPLILSGSFHNPSISVVPGYKVAEPIIDLIKTKSN